MEETPTDSLPGILMAEEMSLEELKNFAAKQGLRGVPIEDAILEISKLQARKAEAVRSYFEPQIALRDEGIELADSELTSAKDDQTESQRRIDEVSQHLGDLKIRREAIGAEERRIVQTIRTRLIAKEDEFYQSSDERHKERLRLSREEIRQYLTDKLDSAKEAYRIKREVWETNKDEYARKVKAFEAQAAAQKKRFEESLERLKKLSEIGISKTTGGFLVWAGYISFAGVSTVLGGLLKTREKDQIDYVSSVIRGISKVIGDPSLQGFWPTYGKLLLLILASSILIVGSVFLTDWLLGWKFPSWMVSKKDRKAGGVRLNLHNNLSFRIPAITRKSYTQLVASVPFLAILTFLLALIAFGYSSTGAEESKDTGIALASTYVGFVFMLLATSVSILYANYVIESRSLRHAGETDRGHKMSMFRVHWEFAVLMLLLAVSLGYLAFAPIDQRHNNAAWGLVGVFMAFSSMALAYGLIHRGLFKDADRLEDDISACQREIEHYTAAPTIEADFEYVESDDAAQILSDMRLTRHFLDQIRISFGLKKLFASSYRDDALLQALGRDAAKFGKKKRKLLLDPIKALRAMMAASNRRPQVWNEYGLDVSEEDYPEAESLKLQRKALDDDIAETEKSIRELNAKVVALNTHIGQLKTDLDTRRNSRVNKQKEFEAARAQVETNNLRRRVIFTASYSDGAWLRELLNLP